MIKNLIFDFGKVLVDYDYHDYFKSIIHNPAQLAKVTKLLVNDEMQDRLDMETVPYECFINDLIRENPQLEYEIRVVFDRYADIVSGEVPGMRELLTRYKAQGYRLYGLTNWCSKVYETIRQYDIFKLLDGYVISSEEHVIKPNPEIYKILLDRYGLKAAESVFTDDKPVNLKGAVSLGIHTILFKNAAQYDCVLQNICSTQQ